MTSRTKALAGAGLILAFAIALWVLTEPLSIGTASRMGPRFIPLLIAGLLTVFALVLAVKGLLLAPASEEPADDASPFVALKNVALIVGAILLFGHGIRVFGLAPTSFVVTLLASSVAWDINWRQALAMSVVLTAFSVLLFRYALGLNLPVWPV